MLKGKYVSVLGDSISTYKGVSNDENAHSSIKYNPYRYSSPFPREKTYWQAVIHRLGATLCVNNSWSGGNLSGREDVTAGVNRVTALAQEKGASPDLIILFMGINDLGRGIAPEVFFADYLQTLSTIRCAYPLAKTCCVNLPDRDPRLLARAEAFNCAIAEAVALAGEDFFVADLFHSPLRDDVYYDNTLDGLHPDEDGMRMIADVVEQAIRTAYTP